MLAVIGRWIERRRGQCLLRGAAARHPRGVRTDRAEFYHWAKVAAEVARIAPLAEMDIDVVHTVVAEEERDRT